MEPSTERGIALEEYHLFMQLEQVGLDDFPLPYC